MEFTKSIYFGCIIKGDLHGAISYVKQFPEQIALYNRFMSVFEQEKYITYEVDAELNQILAMYQRYYRDVFYLCIGKKQSEDRLRARLSEFLGIHDTSIKLCDLEQNYIVEVFRRKGLYFLGGKTGGYYGPYIWKTTETITYEVELPDGIQSYTVKLLDGFITRSWIDYLSFGEIGTGGWADSDEIINCVKSSYDLESEAFKVSLLKHEAQHVRDLTNYKSMSSEDLEYRAKLVELIYSRERNLLEQFIREADTSDKGNGHAMASHRIVEGFMKLLDKDNSELYLLPIEQVQMTAKALFEESGARIFG